MTEENPPVREFRSIFCYKDKIVRSTDKRYISPKRVRPPVPTNEAETVTYFKSLYTSDFWQSIRIRRSYPDAIFERLGKVYFVEFEYKAANFRIHKHDPGDCDVLVCWKNNLGKRKPREMFHIIELCNDDWLHTPIDHYGGHEPFEMVRWLTWMLKE